MEQIRCQAGNALECCNSGIDASAERPSSRQDSDEVVLDVPPSCAITAFAVAIAAGGMLASCATLMPWLSRLIPGRRRCEYEKKPSCIVDDG
jgi:hypothetical protein